MLCGGDNIKKVEHWEMNGLEEKMIKILAEADIPKSSAKILIFLLKFGEGKSSEIEKTMNMRQPESSNGATTLIKQGLVKYSIQKKPGKGRPTHTYSLINEPEEICALFEKKILKNIKAQKDKISELKEIITTMKI